MQHYKLCFQVLKNGPVFLENKSARQKWGCPCCSIPKKAQKSVGNQKVRTFLKKELQKEMKDVGE